ncbi:MAG: hypothetical protein K0U19_05035 [Proteobacteria bacterium]|nr:hypothetical protein [Pseudomonadota bacterium]
MATFIGSVASAALITLATTGNPSPLQEELGGTIIESNTIAAESVLTGEEHLAPDALQLEDGTLIAMVAPTITKDNFVVVRDGEIQRLDVGFTEGTNTPFLVEDVADVTDGGASIIEQIGHWFDNLIN